MIELIKAPDSNRILADGNSTPIMVRSTGGNDHYIRGKIFIDGQVFLEKSWSKDEQGVSTFDLQHLYYSYFENPFSFAIQSGYRPKPELIRNVRVRVEEFRVGSDQSSSILELPEFSVICNLRPVKFDDTVSLRFLDFPQQTMKAPRDKGLVFPLYVRQGSFKMQLLNHLGNPIHEETIQVDGATVHLWTVPEK